MCLSYTRCYVTVNILIKCEQFILYPWRGYIEILNTPTSIKPNMEWIYIHIYILTATC